MKIQTKLSLSLLVTAVVITMYMTFFIQWNFGRGFLHYVNSVEDREVVEVGERLGEFWAKNNDWSFLSGDSATFYKIYAETLSDGALQKKILEKINRSSSHWSSPKGILPPFANLPLIRRLYVFDRNYIQLYGYDAHPESGHLLPVLYKDAVVGYLGHHPVSVLKQKDQQTLVREQKRATLLIGIAALLITFGMSIPFARQMARPLKELSMATRRLIGGDFSVRLYPKTRDEIGQLTKDFNSLATSLEHNEITQKRWLTDISHELRTPLAILQGEIEAMQDGIRKTDQEGLASLHREVLHINHLVEDLYQLSRAEDGLIYNKESLNLVELIKEQANKYSHEFIQQELSFDYLCQESSILVLADRSRILQVIDNVFHNSLRYTDSGGGVKVKLEVVGQVVRLSCDDSAPTVALNECSQIFDRLYRVDRSRNRNLGGAGIGLAVCQNIIKAHDGKIVAMPSSMGGLSLQIILPLQKGI